MSKNLEPVLQFPPRSGLTSIIEGGTKLIVPKRSMEAPNPPKQPGFFNPLAELCRDVSVIITRVVAKRIGSNVIVGDPLASLGARGLRIAVEAPEVDQVYMNDLNPSALACAEEAASLNSVAEKCRFSNVEACVFLIQHSKKGFRFNLVDIDPFGSPAPFIDCGLRAVKDGGMLSVTATDSPVLCGLHPTVALRRYGGVSLRTEYSHEIGARLLAAMVVKEAARLDLAAIPVFAHTKRLYTRVFFEVTHDVGRASEALRKLGYVNHCYKCNTRIVSSSVLPGCSCGSSLKSAGPVWVDNLCDPVLVKEAQNIVPLSEKKEIKVLFDTALQEVDLPPHHHLLDKEAMRIGTAPPKIQLVLDMLGSQ
ncbi:MAG: hypothetical protein HY619_02455, partial [Thaumarchaeota archaeon]|nr:hypothetical protein [Nitrososphaerota archaeon]